MQVHDNKNVLLVLMGLMLLFLGFMFADEEYLKVDPKILLSAFLVALAVTTASGWYKKKGKTKLTIFFRKLKGLPDFILTKANNEPKNYAMGAVVKEGKIIHCYFAVSNEMTLEDIKVYNGIECTVCNNHDELNSKPIKKYDPDGEEIEEYIIYTEHEKKHATCAERKIIAEFVERYNSDEIDYLIMFTYLAMCDGCLQTVMDCRERGYKITVVDQAYISRICEEVEDDKELTKEEVDFIKGVLKDFEKIKSIKKVK